jgi:hypothetical protein
MDSLDDEEDAGVLQGEGMKGQEASLPQAMKAQLRRERWSLAEN